MSCTRSGDRTRTDIAAHGILSPACLPVPPSGRFGKRRANIGNIRRKSKVVSARRGGTRSRSDSIDANVFCIRRKSKVVSARRGGTRSRSDSIEATGKNIRREAKLRIGCKRHVRVVGRSGWGGGRGGPWRPVAGFVAAVLPRSEGCRSVAVHSERGIGPGAEAAGAVGAAVAGPSGGGGRTNFIGLRVPRSAGETLPLQGRWYVHFCCVAAVL